MNWNSIKYQYVRSLIYSYIIDYSVYYLWNNR